MAEEKKNWLQKGWSGATRVAGGVADYATMGLTDFDKRGSSNYQFGPISGGEDGRWSTRAEAKAEKEALEAEKAKLKSLSEITKDTPKKGAPENLPKNLRYPFSSIDASMDFIKFTVFKYKRNQNKREGDNTSSYVTRDQNQLMGLWLGDIILPIPAQLSDTNTANYGPSSMNFMQEKGLDAAQALIAQGGTDKAGKSINAVIEGLTSKAGSQAVSNFFSAQAVNQLGGNLDPAQVLARGTGAVINPNMELLFSGPSLRNFSYSFKMTPRFEQEAHTIRTIIKAFKRNMAPKGAGGNFLKTPNIFQIQYLYEGKPHPYLNRIKLCALTNVATNYTGDGTYATYSDGSPISMQLNLTFSELTPIFNEDYLAYDNNDDGVGY